MPGDAGKAIRLARLLAGPDGRAACLALDHGAQLGPIAGIEAPERVIADAVAARMDGIILAPGLAARLAGLLCGRDKPSVILRLDQTSMWRVGAANGYPSGHTRQIATVEEAVQLGADAVITYFFTGHREPELETRSIEIAAECAQAARRWGMPIVMEPMAARGGILADPFTAETIAANCRMAAEIGADIVKTDWSGDAASFRQVVETAGVPVLVAGGAREGDDAGVLATVDALLEAGAKGVLFGRNLFQSATPRALMQAVRSRIHEGARAPETVEV
ncbi:MAG: fructose-bisphosphate aldolase [Pseudomonadota bacterium]